METNISNAIANETNGLEAKKHLKETAGKMGWRYGGFAVVVIGIQLLASGILSAVAPQWVTENISLFQFLLIIFSVDIIGFPFIFLLTKKIPATKLESHNMGFGKLVICVLIGAGICGAGMIIGSIFHFALTIPFGVNTDDANQLGNLMLSSDAFIRILTVGILAPIFEELIFRKVLIDRIVKHGEFIAILMSGLMFGLFHGNFSQFFFATGLGLFWAFIYIRTGKIWYTILFHMIINLSSSVITVYLSQSCLQALSEAGEDMSGLTQEGMGVMFIYLGWMGILMICCIAGIILFIVNRKKFCLNANPSGISKKEMAGSALSSKGMIFYYIPCILLFLMAYAPAIIDFFANK